MVWFSRVCRLWDQFLGGHLSCSSHWAWMSLPSLCRSSTDLSSVAYSYFLTFHLLLVVIFQASLTLLKYIFSWYFPCSRSSPREQILLSLSQYLGTMWIHLWFPSGWNKKYKTEVQKDWIWNSSESLSLSCVFYTSIPLTDMQPLLG